MAHGLAALTKVGWPLRRLGLWGPPFLPPPPPVAMLSNIRGVRLRAVPAEDAPQEPVLYLATRFSDGLDSGFRRRRVHSPRRVRLGMGPQLSQRECGEEPSSGNETYAGTGR